MQNEIDRAVDNLLGWCTKEKATVLTDLVLQVKKPVLELGIYGGKSFIPMAIAAQEVGVKAYGVDAWDTQASLEGNIDELHIDWWGKLDHDEIKQSYYQGLKDFKLENVTTYEMTSKQALSELENLEFGVIHQDSNHSTEVSTWEVEHYSGLLAKDGYWIIDDVEWNTTQKAQNMLGDKFNLIKVYTNPNGTQYAVYKHE